MDPDPDWALLRGLLLQHRGPTDSLTDLCQYATGLFSLPESRIYQYVRTLYPVQVT